ncbi:MAG: hydantoinase/oxoprolinase family protein [Bradymonadaceae bacterium]
MDTGGTFTDVVLRDDDGRLEIHKLLSTPSDPSRAIAEGVAAIRTATSASHPHIIHGTTVATNALLERRGAKVAFITTAGFEDLLFLRRQNRPYLYAFDIELRPPLIEETSSFGADERIAYDGRVLHPLSKESVERILARLEEGGFEAVAISLLHAYANPVHELRLLDAITKRMPSLHVSASHQVARVFREYERGSTTTINAFVGPVMARYLESLEGRLPGHSIEILQSHGGRTDLEHAARFPVHTVLSGPAGGVVGALEAAREVGIDRIITFDMGGTSTDVSLCDGEPTVATWSEIDGLPLLVPVIDIFTVGAGGGSIAYADAGGALRVGPQSAGANPGPAAYGRGGKSATVTDAHVTLGSLRPDRFLGGTMNLDAEASLRVIASLAEELGMGSRELARGILEIADIAMSRAIKVISLERGHDPRDYTLVAFGGAGGLHACRLADSLGMERVLVARHPGLLSAWGMLQARSQRFYEKTVLRPLAEIFGDEEGRVEIELALSELEEIARKESHGSAEELRLDFSAELRYQGQSFEIPVEIDWRSGSSSWIDPGEDFAREHERLYGYRAEGWPVELVTLRLRASTLLDDDKTLPEEMDVAQSSSTRAVVGFGTGDEETTILERLSIAEGSRHEGPLIITEYSGTTVVPPGWWVQSANGHLLLTREGP